jgi:hypothetical protein
MGLQNLLEDYRNWVKTQEWKNKKQDERLFGGDPVLQEEFEKWSGGFSPSNLGGGLSGLAGIFAGPRSSKADLAMLTKAKQLTKSGTDREQVWQETGWFQAPWDQKWRYEIPDADMAPQEGTGWLNQYHIGPHIEKTHVGSAYSHPELFKAYPDIADMELYADPNISSKAFYSPDLIGQSEFVSLNIDRPDEIAKTRRYLAEMREPSHSNYWRKQLDEEGLGNDREAIKEQLQYMQGMKKGLAELQAGKIWPAFNEENVRSSLLHELQHAIQQREGFARGGSADEFLNGGPINPKTGQQYTIDEAQDMYKRMGGEVEARMTQKRMNYSPLYRKWIHPLKSIEDKYPIESIYDPQGIVGLLRK